MPPIQARSWGVLAALLLLLATLSASGQPPSSERVASPDALASPALGAAFERFKAMDYEGTLKALKPIVAENAELPPAPVILAQWFAQAGEPGQMRVALERAVAEEPNDPEAYVLLSDVALREGRLAEGELLSYRAYNLLEPFQRSQRRKNLLVPRVLSNLAAVCEAREDWPGARKYLQAWLAMEPEGVAAMQRLGQVLFRLGQPGEALARFRTAAKLDPNVLAPEMIMARLYQQADQPAKAAESLAAALRAGPNEIKTRLAAAQLDIEAGQYAEAQKQADAALKLNRDSLEGKHLKALSLLFQRDYAGAQEVADAAVKQAPASFTVSNNLAVILAEQNDQAKRLRALEYAQANLRQYPRQAEVYSTLGWVLFRLGRIDEAERALRMATSNGSISPDTGYFLARIAADQGRVAEARQLLQSALAGKAPFLLRKEAEELLEKVK